MPSTVEIIYDRALCNNLLKLTAPENIPASLPDETPASSLIQLSRRPSGRWFRFKDAVFRGLDLSTEDIKVGGILQVEDALGRLSWVGQIVKPESVTDYPLPVSYLNFRRWIDLLPTNSRAVVRIQRYNEYTEDSDQPPPQSWDISCSTTESSIHPSDWADFFNDSDSNARADNHPGQIKTAPDNGPEDSLAVSPPVHEGLPPAKRQCLNWADFNQTMAQFFALSNLMENDKHTLSVIQKHSIYHWSVFKGMTQAELEEAGFKLGPARLIVAGATAAVAHLEKT
ncbi:hypothetical protein PTTG_28333 [Puccinia triticina 1-1 BBBD Race 1]|uniref:SAM domain-containing protein n=1 Tax=Puccinia triticina (isolate 1-1 / race 1 (BBBD)) TaxID=630390 RepID=A0A180GCX2_PUCT1|nr:hypothetical protein PTTG_28333 [Puccinia triticina 1-1 BBBD Race 1]